MDAHAHVYVYSKKNQYELLNQLMGQHKEAVFGDVNNYFTLKKRSEAAEMKRLQTLEFAQSEVSNVQLTAPSFLPGQTTSVISAGWVGWKARPLLGSFQINDANTFIYGRHQTNPCSLLLSLSSLSLCYCLCRAWFERLMIISIKSVTS
jgi:hypothetical protein